MHHQNGTFTAQGELTEKQTTLLCATWGGSAASMRAAAGLPVKPELLTAQQPLTCSLKW